MASGPLVGAVVGWSVFLHAVYAGPSEAAALVQYTATYLPGLVDEGSLTVPGRLVAIPVLGVFCAVNWFGVRLVATVNNVVTVIKVAVRC